MNAHPLPSAGLRLLFLAGLLVACAGDGDDTDGALSECGDIDGNGGDTGDVPNTLGNWTASYGGKFLDGNCRSEDVPKETLDFLAQPFLMEGSARATRATFADNPDLALRGTTAPSGALALSGIIVAGGVDLHTAVGGMLYEDASGRVRWDGGAFIGADLNGDAIIDCEFNTDWSARKSGS